MFFGNTMQNLLADLCGAAFLLCVNSVKHRTPTGIYELEITNH